MNFTTPPPEGVLDPKIPWSRINPNSRLWLILKARLTGKPQGDGYNYSSYVNISNEEADRLIANMKKDPMGYPSLDQESGTPPQWMERQKLYQEWLVERYLTNESAFTESFVDTTKPVEEKVVEEAQEVVEEVEEEVKDNLEEASKQVDEKIEEQATPDLTDLPVNVQQSLIDLINKRTGSNIPKPESEKKNTGVTNTTILRTLTASLQKIQGQLTSIDNEIKKQNQMIGSALGTVVSNLNHIETSYEGLNDKFDALLAAFEAQTQGLEDAADQAETDAAIAKQKQQGDTASTFGFDDVDAKGGLFGALVKFFGKKLGKFLARSLFKLLPKKAKFSLLRKLVQAKRIRALTKNLGGRALGYGLRSLARGTLRPQLGNIRRLPPTNRISRFAQGVVKRHNLNIFDPRERAASMAFKPVNELAEAAAEKGALKGGAEKLTSGGGMNVFQKALKSKAVQNALVKKLGKEGAEKLTVKLAAKLVPGISTAYGVGEGIARIAMGDIKGGFLSFGSAIPVAGWGFAAVDILRDIDTDAYTKHIESNLPAPSGGNFGAFFAEALGVTEDQYEVGTDSTKPGDAILHGTEAIIPKDAYAPAILSPVAGALIGASSNFLTQAGPAASLVAPMFKQTANSLAQVFNVPTTLAQTNVGGSFAGIDSTLKDTKKSVIEKHPGDDEIIDASPQDKKVLDEFDGKSGGFFGKLMNVFGIRTSPDYHPGDDTDAGEVGGDGKFIQGNSGASYGIHFHIAPGSYQDGNITDSSGNADARSVAEKVINHFKGQKTIYIGRSGEFVNEKDDSATIKRKVQRGQEVHTSEGSQGGIDLQIGGAYYPGAKVAFPLKTEGLKYRRGGFGVTAKVSGANASVAHGLYDETGKQAPQEGASMYGGGGDTPSVATSVIVGDRGREKIMKNLVVSYKPIDKHLDAMNAASSSSELINTYKAYAPEVLMYDEEAEAEASTIVVMNSSQPAPSINTGSNIDPYAKRSQPTENSSKTMLMQKLLV